MIITLRWKKNITNTVLKCIILVLIVGEIVFGEVKWKPWELFETTEWFAPRENCSYGSTVPSTETTGNIFKSYSFIYIFDKFDIV